MPDTDVAVLRGRIRDLHARCAAITELMCGHRTERVLDLAQDAVDETKVELHRLEDLDAKLKRSEAHTRCM